MEFKERQIRAVFDSETITVYQAYRKEIAQPAVENQKFVTPFKMDRMTWIKPSFFWMMYRCGWGVKTGQEHVLSIKIKRTGFEWALNHACLSHFDPKVHETYEKWKDQLVKSPVRIQWDPERDIHLNKLDYRSIQIGLSGKAVKLYVNDWIVSIEDISAKCKEISSLVSADLPKAQSMIPKEELFEIDFRGREKG